MKSRITIVCDIAPAVGWAPVRHMQRLLQRLLQADFHDISGEPSSRVQSVVYPHVKRSVDPDGGLAIFITWGAYGARKFVPFARQVGGFSRTVLWIVDSFWTDATMRERKVIDRHFDDIIYMQSFDDEFYTRLFGSRALRLDWGSDVLAFGGFNGPRANDLLRIGRQPATWEDDQETARACRALGLKFSGRPPAECPIENLSEFLMRSCYGQTKFVLAHSNVEAPSPDTHRTKAYMTARWTDAIASGAVVAGMPPIGDIHLLDWPECLLRLPSLDRQDGLRRIASALSAWTPAIARINYLQALRHLDWRWRFKKLLSYLDLQSAAVDREISLLNTRIGEVVSGNSDPP